MLRVSKKVLLLHCQSKTNNDKNSKNLKNDKKMEKKVFEIEIEGKKMEIVGNAADIMHICLSLSILCGEAAVSYDKSGYHNMEHDAWQVRKPFSNIYNQLKDEASK